MGRESECERERDTQVETKGEIWRERERVKTKKIEDRGMERERTKDIGGESGQRNTQERGESATFL